MLLVPWLTHAAGLGKLTVTSALGEPLAAKIELISVHKDELNSLAARVADEDAYKQANLQYQPLLSTLRFKIEGGTEHPYIQITSTAPIEEPVVNLLVQLAWSTGNIAREYSLLLDPPDYNPWGRAGPPHVAIPESKPIIHVPSAAAPQPLAPPPAPSARAVTAAPQPAATAPKAAKYGPVKRGETLMGIARSVKPAGVTVEQMLVGLYRANPDAFARDNMNWLKAGQILRVPNKAQVEATGPQDALEDVRVQARDWNAYRMRLAAAARSAPKSHSIVSGRITTHVEDQSAGRAKRDVLRLSKGVAPGAGAGAAKKGGQALEDRLKVLEEDAIAREKALADANQRIAQLEKTIREQQRLLELKGVTIAPVKSAPAPAQAPQAVPAAPAEKPVTAAALPAKAPAAAHPPKPQTKAKPKVVPPPPAPSLVDMVLDEPLYLAGAAALLLLAALGYLQVRRRRAAASEPAPVERATPALGAASAAPVEAVAAASDMASSGTAEIAAPEEVDALAEAEVYIAYGRDAQAEAILKEALAKSPTRTDVQLKLLEVYAARQDRQAFKGIAEKLKQQTAGEGEAWAKAAAMGRLLDAGDPLYGVAETPVAQTPALAATAELADLDIGATAAPLPAPLEIAPARVEPTMAVPELPPLEPELPPIEPELPAAAPEVSPEQPQASAPLVEPSGPSFTLEVPPKSPPPAPAAAAPESNVIDFNLELPQVEEPEPPKAPAPAAAAGADAGLDFKLDFSDINLNLENLPPAPAAGEKDAHWHDVQQKFDLAKAYEEMGDKEGAREVLQEVIGEGDAEQQARAKRLLEAIVV